MKENFDNNFEVSNIQNIFELGVHLKKFGGGQKFVLLKDKDSYFIGSLPDLSHLEILESMTGGKKDKIEVLGGGLFSFIDNTITIHRNFYTSKLGPIQIKYSILLEIMQSLVGDKYKVELSE